MIELVDWLFDIYPQRKNLFLYRHAETWLGPCLRGYSDGLERTDAETRVRENQISAFMTPLVPLIAPYDPQLHFSNASILVLVWLSALERYLAYHPMGIDMLAIRYVNWHPISREIAEAMLNYCGYQPADVTAIYETLTRDWQAGTVLAQEVLKTRDRKLNDLDLAEIKKHLQAPALINDAGFELANTLHI